MSRVYYSVRYSQHDLLWVGIRSVLWAGEQFAVLQHRAGHNALLQNGLHIHPVVLPVSPFKGMFHLQSRDYLRVHSVMSFWRIMHFYLGCLGPVRLWLASDEFWYALRGRAFDEIVWLLLQRRFWRRWSMSTEWQKCNCVDQIYHSKTSRWNNPPAGTDRMTRDDRWNFSKILGFSTFQLIFLSRTTLSPILFEFATVS